MNTSWRPTATFELLRYRARILATIRQFFESRDILEVETPLLSANTVTDPHLASFCTQYEREAKRFQRLYLQTSPEFAMKRLLAAGSGPIYQITRAFRNQGEYGRWHNPEFTILEWYRPNFNLSQLMDETEALLQSVLHCPAAQRLSYAQLFSRYSALDPHQATLMEIKKLLIELKINLEPLDWLDQRDTGLQLITDYFIRHCIDTHQPLFLYDFPTSQAALSRIKEGTPPVAERFEVYYGGLELANAFYELKDPVEQKERFLHNLSLRNQYHLDSVPIDENLIAALHHGLPDCSGIALGVDRLVALATRSNTLEAVLTFPITRA